MRTVDRSTLGLDQETLQYAADDLWQELKAIERCYPYVLDDGAYRQLKQACTEFAYGVPTEDGLNGLYMAIIECLRAISVQTTNVVSLAAKREGVKLLSDYLPPTFEDFVNRITKAKLQAEYYMNAYAGTAEALFMAELEDGIDAVVPSHREAVKERIYEILLENADGDGESIAAIERTNTADILRLIGIKDGFDLLSAAMDQGFKKVAEIILAVREEIDSQYTNIVDAKLRLERPSIEEFNALDSGMRKLISAMAEREPRHCDMKELGRAHRMELASRITRPQLKVVKDKRPTILEARELGLTSLEIKVLAMTGYLRMPPRDEGLQYNDPNTPIGGMEERGIRSLGDLEDLARLGLGLKRPGLDPDETN